MIQGFRLIHLAIMQSGLTKHLYKMKYYANSDPADHPETFSNNYAYLGLSSRKSLDQISLRSKPIYLKTKKTGSVDVII